MNQLRPLIPLLVTAGILIGGNGLQGTFIALRALDEGFSTSLIGLVGTGYNIGFAIGCIYVTRVIRAIGHIRAFSALAAIASAAALAMALLIDPVSWFILRLISGLCFAGLFAVMESWLNAKVTNATRARTLSIYRFVDLGSVTLAQYMIPSVGIDGFALFAIISMALTLSLVPISFADKSSPALPEAIRFDVRALWNISPLATAGCIAIGLSNSAFRALGPIYGKGIGMSVTSIATFMSVGILAGVVLQYPLGHYSDRLDRRLMILVSSGGAMIACLFIGLFARDQLIYNYLGIFFFGAFAMPLYSLCSAHANDHAQEGQHALVSAGTLFFWSVGATFGPMVASVLIDHLGAESLFLYLAFIFFLFMLYTLNRMATRRAVPVEKRHGRFRSLLRTSIFFNKLATPPDEREP
ncbi:MFS transporter [Gellertiella hungarica]|uniref:MFS family permease n=1 Tax=Gellertiella hungarica TaxID=1572859 RepID=A0A7W6J7X1_9HYPH|nr:MFS transporter [Gellertiella hungarica]MBB4065511.1 MFS family permease [Gellertiella hungarica]